MNFAAFRSNLSHAMTAERNQIADATHWRADAATRRTEWHVMNSWVITIARSQGRLDAMEAVALAFHEANDLGSAAQDVTTQLLRNALGTSTDVSTAGVAYGDGYRQAAQTIIAQMAQIDAN